jgi:hypothetical protein
VSDGRPILLCIDSNGGLWNNWKVGPASDSEWVGWYPFNQNLSSGIQGQQQTNWCWAAVACSVTAYYDPKTTWTQCQIVNKQRNLTTCCADGSSSECNQKGDCGQALADTGHLANYAGILSFDEIVREVEAGHPVGIRVMWGAGPVAHAIVVTGWDTDQFVHIDDPEPVNVGSEYLVPYTTLVEGTFSGNGVWTNSWLTKP